MNNKKEGKKDLKKIIKDFWFLVWKDDSFKGWLLSIIFIFLIIKFIFFPFLSLITGTSLPLAIVESCSMYHEGNLFSNFDLWWENNEYKYQQFDIEKQDFSSFPLKKGFNKGDVLILGKADPEKLEIGDIIVFEAGQRNPVIHRIVEIIQENDKKYFSTIGDNNLGQTDFEKRIPEEKIIGKTIFKALPYAGWIKLVFFEWQKHPSQRGLC